MAGCGHVLELHYNAALLAHRQGDLQEALSQVSCVGRSEQLAGWLAVTKLWPWMHDRPAVRPMGRNTAWLAGWLPGCLPRA